VHVHTLSTLRAVFGGPEWVLRARLPSVLPCKLADCALGRSESIEARPGSIPGAPMTTNAVVATSRLPERLQATSSAYRVSQA
jgi:hypothetical protein